ncbi:LacI family DNA-binding transcriptional regulator [Bifidobacterium sp. ESL0763]|uniref:LacI family DNA-binding transcriptional regulator n=1 Tax=Bifidobacterium sp. ESL0763 TaxID=2983227 RepID=UPI0023FA1421|nr:LacI family DNA-binding transcriptional regulator [Bifidobacterium sp. ESL0763]MDF7663254.1 LacI family DNA-binding transcriptional regulator [Bifidobacterium sp. ESL0763]
MGSRVTLKDVAKMADVSIAAASRVLNGRPVRVSPGKHRRIVEAARALRYVPNQAARSLATKRSMLLALLVPDIENMFFASMAKALEDAVSAEGYTLVVANSDDSRAIERNVLTQFRARGVDGLFLVPSRESVKSSEGLRGDVESLDFPVILTDRLVEEPWCDGIGSDNFTGGLVAAQTLVGLGHRRVACISGDNTLTDSGVRRKGFVSGLRHAGLELDPALDCDGDYRFSSGYRMAGRIVEAGATAVFCGNDLMALGFIKRLGELGVRCPEEFSVIGYDNIDSRLGLELGLTTLDQDVRAVAEACRGCMKARLDGDDSDDRQLVHCLVRPRFVRGKTVARPPEGR